MGYKLTVKQNVSKAFKLLKDLATLATFSSQNATGFDFSSNEPVLSAVVPTDSLVVEIATKRKTAEAGVATKTILLESGKLPNLSVYDTVTFPSGGTWNIVVPYDDDGYLVTMTLTGNV